MKLSLSALFFFHAMNDGSAESLRYTTSRNLFEKIHSYEPMSVVTDSAALDRDLHVIRKELAKETKRGWENAEKVYRAGAFSKPVATLTLHDKLKQDLEEGTTVRGLDVGGYKVSGLLYKEAKEGSNEVTIQYDISENQANYVNCQVGANPAPNVEGCFNSTGHVRMHGKNYSYFYNIYDENVNYRNIADLSSNAKSKMWECSHCPFPDFEKFYNYYGEFNYADRIITHAFRGEQTYLKNGNMDFGYYTEYALGNFLHKAMSYMSIWMYTIRQMEQAIAECEKGNFDDGVHYWDEAVAYYTGSRSLNPNTNGELIFHQAELRCDEFVTCGENSNSRDGQSYVNFEAFRHFEDGQQNVKGGKCKLARKNKERIVAMMTIPLIQGTLRYAHIIAHEDHFYEKHGAEATLFTLSVLPLIHDCSPHNAKIIYDNMKSKNTANVDFKAVKKAFENSYHCLNLQCGEVGGIYDHATGEYKSDAEPCGQGQVDLAAILGGAAGGLLLLALIGFIALKIRQRKASAKEVVDDPLDDVSLSDVPVEYVDKELT